MFKVINQYLLTRMVKDSEKTDDQVVRASYGYLEGWTSIVLNVVLAISKLICGFWINSISLIADAFHTLSDVLTSVAVVVGFKIAGKPDDKEHPFGHGRAEHIITLVISTLLIVVGIKFLMSSVDKFINPEPVGYNAIVFAVMIGSAILKEWLFNFARFLGLKINSKALIADAWHHRSDAIASLLIGIALLATRFGFDKADAILGVIVSIMIIYTGGSLIRECFNEILGMAPSKDFVEQVQNIALQVEGVKDIHDIEVHQYGYKKYVNLHIAVEPELSVRQSHSIAKFVEKNLIKNLQVKPLVHIDPY